MRSLTTGLILVSLLLLAAIFGFFYAWVCSTMWGLDEADPRVAIAAMQAMNASVRNAFFAPAFFATPVVVAVTALMLFWQGERRSALAFWASALVYLFFGLLLTTLVNVPMNEALALVVIPEDLLAARAVWLDYSRDWQVWNQTRTIASGAAFLLALWGVLLLRRGRA
ncbi:MAG: DUF1772 domain-containing protein [Qingshengfaniella sp.]